MELQKEEEKEKVAFQNKCTYFGLDYLRHDLSEFPELCKVYIYTYRINNTGKYPFLEFIMEYMVDSFSFPTFIYTSYTDTNNYADIHDAESVVNSVVNSDVKSDVEYIIEQLTIKKSFRGFFSENVDDCHAETKTNAYLFFESNEPITDADMFYKEDKHWIVTVDEIVNQRRVCNIPVNPEVTCFFLKNPFFSFIRDENINVCETPVVKYSGVCDSLLKIRSIFGMPASEKTEIMGPYYYFTNFEGAVKNGAWSANSQPEYIFDKLVTEETGKYKKGGVIRFALFLGNVKVPMNRPNDDVDTSLTKKALLNMDTDTGGGWGVCESTKKTVTGGNIHRQTMRISDHDGKWTEEYDSVQLGILELDDGSKLIESPLWVVNDYDRITPISYHYIDKSTIGDTWHRDAKYQIQ